MATRGTGTEKRQLFGGADVRKRLWQGGGGDKHLLLSLEED